MDNVVHHRHLLVFSCLKMKTSVGSSDNNKTSKQACCYHLRCTSKSRRFSVTICVRCCDSQFTSPLGPLVPVFGLIQGIYREASARVVWGFLKLWGVRDVAPETHCSTLNPRKRKVPTAAHVDPKRIATIVLPLGSCPSIIPFSN